MLPLCLPPLRVFKCEDVSFLLVISREMKIDRVERKTEKKYPEVEIPTFTTNLMLQIEVTVREQGCDCSTCGVVMMTAPSTWVELRYCTIDKCSSDVPGGVSTMR